MINMMAIFVWKYLKRLMRVVENMKFAWRVSYVCTTHILYMYTYIHVHVTIGSMNESPNIVKIST